MKKIVKKVLTMAFAAVVSLSAWTQQERFADINTQTFVYAVTEGDSLKMDIYTCKNIKADALQPMILYQHGGGWDSDDTRLGGKKWLARMARMGYVCGSIDYRLGIRRKRLAGEKMEIKDFGKWYDYTIRLGVEDFFDATTFVLKHAKELNVNPKCIIAAGGSAGAVDVSTAEYWLCNGDEIATKHLPSDFNYAGVIACAGGVWDWGLEEPVWKRKPCPFLLFHGDKDQAVPYDRVLQEVANYSAYGSLTLAKQFHEMKVPYLFLSGKDCDHALSGLPMINCTELMHSFIKRAIFDGEQLEWNITEQYYDEPRTIPYVLKNLDKYKDDL